MSVFYPSKSFTSFYVPHHIYMYTNTYIKHTCMYFCMYVYINISVCMYFKCKIRVYL